MYIPCGRVPGIILAARGRSRTPVASKTVRASISPNPFGEVKLNLLDSPLSFWERARVRAGPRQRLQPHGFGEVVEFGGGAD